ncbi:Serine/threonine-protein phosphatase 7 long form-like [Vitis vinifera]|uniref:Serine/threonine-protein phosphatase 7 long form-like n=1 Tax=Vitis vinifera TaxID=29760 RepID=A0A438E527_VITVI|nr:Serine/threonine-protein phosphatase 7 long form-like [Vitis vinifera]
MSECIVPVICFYKGKMLRTETDVKYIGDEAVIVPLDVPVSATYEHLLSMIYSRTGIDKKQFQVVLNCRYPLKGKIVPVQPRVRGQLLGNFTQLLLGQNDNVKEFEYGCGPSSAPVAMTYECRADEDEDEEKCESQEGDDLSERAEDIQHDDDRVFEVIDEENNNVNVVSSFLALHEAMEDPEDPIEFSPVQYHSAPSLQFENVENIGNAVSSDWTLWGNTNIGNLGGEFMVGQVFNSKADLKHAAKLYSISAHQEYIVVESTTKLLVLRCKKAKQSQCPWKLRAMVVKGTTSFAINKYNGLHKCVNPCLNLDHQQLDSNLIAAYIQGMIKTQFTLSVAAIQASIVEKFGYQISYKKTSKAKLKALTNLFSDFYKSYAEQPYFFIALEQANPGCVVISKTFPGIMENTEIFQEQGANRLASNEEYTPYVDAKIKANVVKTGSHEIVLYDHVRGQFHVKTNKGTRVAQLVVEHIASTYRNMEYRGHSFDPDPLDTFVLVLQDRHRFMREWEMDSRLRPYIIQSGFYGVYRIGHITLDWGLITSLVERWRPETYTFHLPVGEMTITLQDVAVILGLRIHGLPITGTCDIDWSLLCYELLGVTPSISEIRGSAISTRWLCHQFSQPLVDLDDATLEWYARAFILGLIVLAHLYRSCVEQVWTVPPILLDVSHYYRLHVGRPDFGRPPAPPAAQHLEHDAADDLPAEWRVPLSWAQNPSRVLTFYRDQLDAQTHDQVLWEPYMGDLVVHLLTISLANQEIWRTMSPLICFDIVEWHRPEQVLRQFGLQQGIRPSCSIELDLHSVDRPRTT